jgi:hypothetical protein
MSTDLEPTKTRRPMTTYTEPQILAGLTQLAICGGNARLANEHLTSLGYDIPAETLAKWRTHTHPDRYQQIQQDLAPRIAEKIAAQAEEFIIAATEVEAEALAHLRSRLTELTPSEAAGALRNITTSKALNLDKVASPLRGRPSHITEVRGTEEILRSLAQKIPSIDSTAEELTEEPNQPASS